MDPTQDKLRLYIEKVLEIKDRKQSDALSEGDLEVLVRDLGFSENDIREIEHSCRAHIQRGEGYARYRLWDDAVVEFSQAQVLRPFDIGVRCRLAEAYLQRWLTHGRDDDRSAAGRLARQCLESDPGHTDALNILSDLKQASARPLWTRPFVYIGGILLALFIGGGIAWYLAGPGGTPYAPPTPVGQYWPVAELP